MPDGPRGVAELVAAIEPADDTERSHQADLSLAGGRPVMVTMTLTREQERHTDVSLWYLLAGSPGLPVELDRREFASGRWWAADEIESADPALFDPNMGRFLAKLRASAG